MKVVTVLLVALMLVGCGGRDATPTPRPVPTFTPTVDLLEAYRPAMIEHTGKLAEALANVTHLLADPKFDQDTWFVELGGMIAQVQVSAAAIAKLTPPASLADYHSAMVAAGQVCSEFTEIVTDAIDNRTRADNYVMDRLLEADDLIRSCTSQIAAATKLIPQ